MTKILTDTALKQWKVLESWTRIESMGKIKGPGNCSEWYHKLRIPQQSLVRVTINSTSGIITINSVTIESNSKLILITKHYTFAMLVSLLEYLIEITLFPNLKQHLWISNFGLTMILLGEILRKTPIITAGGSSMHFIKVLHE